MTQKMLRDDQWNRIEALLPGKFSDPGRTDVDKRRFVGAVLRIARRARPGGICPSLWPLEWHIQALRALVRQRRWHRVFEQLAKGADCEEVVLDSTIVRAHQRAAGTAKKGTALRRSQEGLTTKIHALVAGLGCLARWTLTCWSNNDVTPGRGHSQGRGCPDAYDAGSLIEFITRMGPSALIPSREIRQETRAFNTHQYKNPDLMERFFCRLKPFRRIATRYDKLASRFSAFIAIVAASFGWREC